MVSFFSFFFWILCLFVLFSLGGSKILGLVLLKSEGWKDFVLRFPLGRGVDSIIFADHDKNRRWRFDCQLCREQTRRLVIWGWKSSVLDWRIVSHELTEILITMMRRYDTDQFCNKSVAWATTRTLKLDRNIPLFFAISFLHWVSEKALFESIMILQAVPYSIQSTSTCEIRTSLILLTNPEHLKHQAN